MDKILRFAIFGYFAILVGLSFFLFPYGDSFYYWNWGNHLGWSYLDGPPMIAYMMHLSTLLFGVHFFTINIVGVLCGIGTCYFIYKIGSLLEDQKTGLLAALLWVTLPLVNQDLFTRVTYDSPENLFWAITIYFAAIYVQSQKQKWLYAIAISLGLLLLSKYTGVILALGLLIYFLFTKGMCQVFKSVHLYLAGILVFILFSPVLIWNYEHHWVSFVFQAGLHLEPTHPDHSLSHYLQNLLTYLWRAFYGYNLLVIIPLLFVFSKSTLFKTSRVGRLLIILSLVFSGFWILVALNSPSQYMNVKINYFTSGSITLSVLTSYFLLKYGYKKAAIAIAGLYALISFFAFLLCSTIWVNPYLSQDYSFYLLYKKAIHQYKDMNLPFTSLNWGPMSRINFALKTENQNDLLIAHYSSCSAYDGQYQYWQINAPQPKNVIVISPVDLGNCFKPYYKQCKPLPTLESSHRGLFTQAKMNAAVISYVCNS